ncbi:hypothetical protein VNI00_003091 [Paramarasmius palmivorus]|uniref:Major facilitator superfamily (MFS) profile domain-containing protein n=1 Tax=Paramarasmius palmivorus TaxID=297713 RepID=A0AAW0DPT4_9AGAR
MSNDTKPADIESFSLEKVSAASDVSSWWDKAPENPLNWQPGAKWAVIGACRYKPSYRRPIASSIMGPALPDIGQHYGIESETVTALTLSIFLLAWVVGPLFFGPLSEVYGRRWIFIAANVFFLAFNIACIFAPSTGTLIAFRFLAGLGASVPYIYRKLSRQPDIRVFPRRVLLGPPLGPVMGGYLTQTVGFKYCFVVSSALCGAALVVALLFLKETYGPVIRERLSAANSGSSATIDALATNDEAQKHPSNLYAAIIFGILNAFFTTFPILFEDEYGFSPGSTGLTYLGGGLGELLSAIIMGGIGASIYAKLSAGNGGVGKPEYRVPAMYPAAILAPGGLFWYGWSAQNHLHWIMPVLGSAIFCFGMIASLLPIQLYFLDSFTYAASALAATSALRFAFGFAFPLFVPHMISAMGYGGTYSFFGGILLLIGVPFPLWIFYKGEEIRKKSSLTH